MRLKRRVSAGVARLDTDLRPRAHPISLASTASINDLWRCVHPISLVSNTSEGLPHPSYTRRSTVALTHGDVHVLFTNPIQKLLLRRNVELFAGDWEDRSGGRSRHSCRVQEPRRACSTGRQGRRQEANEHGKRGRPDSLTQ